MARNAKQIIEKSIKDIQAGLWICNDLCEVGENAKMMGCAIGLVALNGGLTHTSNVSTYNTKTDEYEVVAVEYAEYPFDEDEWTATKRKSIRSAAFALALAVPKSDEEELPWQRAARLKNNKAFRAELAKPFSATEKATYYSKDEQDVLDGYSLVGDIKDQGYDPLYDAQQTIISYNDGRLKNSNGEPVPAMAERWFKRALKILDKNDTTATKAATETDLKAALAAASA